MTFTYDHKRAGAAHHRWAVAAMGMLAAVTMLIAFPAPPSTAAQSMDGTSEAVGAPSDESGSAGDVASPDAPGSVAGSTAAVGAPAASEVVEVADWDQLVDAVSVSCAEGSTVRLTSDIAKALVDLDIACSLTIDLNQNSLWVWSAVTAIASGKHLTVTDSSPARDEAGKLDVSLLRTAGAHLTITGNAKVIGRIGGDAEAGMADGGTVDIAGNAVVEASGTFYGAAIGGDQGGSGGEVNISGQAVVAAESSSNGAGIGGGMSGVGGTVTISGDAKVTATGYSGAGIGGGTGRWGGDVEISGGAVVEASSWLSAGIGAGSGGQGGTVSVSDHAEVTASGGAYGAGIGGAGEGGAGGPVRVTGEARVVASATFAAAIGGGSPAVGRSGAGGSLFVGEGAVVSAVGASHRGGAGAVGPGPGTTSSGDVRIDGTLRVPQGSLHVYDAPDFGTFVVGSTGRILGAEGDPTGAAGVQILGGGTIVNDGVIGPTDVSDDTTITHNSFRVSFLRAGDDTASPEFQRVVYAPSFADGYREFPDYAEGNGWFMEPGGAGEAFTETTPLDPLAVGAPGARAVEVHEAVLDTRIEFSARSAAGGAPVYGDAVELSATVIAGEDRAASGEVTFSAAVAGGSEYEELGAAVLGADGTAILERTVAFEAGEQRVRVDFDSASPRFADSQGEFSADIARAEPAISLETSETGTVGDAIAVAVSVSASPDDAAAVTGDVRLRVDEVSGEVRDAAELEPDGTAMLTARLEEVGEHGFVVDYVGDDNVRPGASEGFVVTAEPAATATTLEVTGPAPDALTYGEETLLKATVTSQDGEAPSGHVSFRVVPADGAAEAGVGPSGTEPAPAASTGGADADPFSGDELIGTAPVGADGIAEIDGVRFAAGVQQVRAVFVSDRTRHLDSEAAQRLDVARAEPVIVLSAPDVADMGETITVDVRVSPATSEIALVTGDVALHAGGERGEVLAVEELGPNGSVSLKVTMETVGEHHLVAVYSGDDNVAAGVSDRAAVRAAAVDVSGELAVTGADRTAGGLMLGVLAAVVGAVLLALRRPDRADRGESDTQAHPQ
ncbi:Ig-like domain-containing protein [Microbacterium halotolerans]|uniref:Ig-like domain-containing protein n=1 Tax=Microbacterium halotolerans TaxID=246613 RepID=UPI000E6A9D58|nr:Ig-like domain-containing protein [Microbacterium halotolerans]